MTVEDLPEPDAQVLAEIATLVQRATGIRLGPGKGYFVRGRLGDLYRSLGCGAWEEFSARFQAAPPQVVERLVGAVVTPETAFFRDGLPFRALREQIVPELLGGGPRPLPLRVWSAGCSTGQEPYSIAMCLWDMQEAGDIDLELRATDICRESLAAAREGVYGKAELGRGLRRGDLRRYFERVGAGAWRVRAALREAVCFEPCNLLSESVPAGAYDVVFCRNVAIYFDLPGKRALFQKLREALRPGGYLVLGGSETLFPSVAGLQTVYFGRSLLFRKLPDRPR